VRREFPSRLPPLCLNARNMKPQISVVLSTHNRASHYLPRAINSVIAQSFQDWELLVIDDGSTDNTSEVVASFTDKRIRYYKIKNFGCDTRPKNTGIQRANADLVAFLDDDNSFRPDHLQALYNAFQKDSSIGVAYADRWVHFEDAEQGQDQIGINMDFDYSTLMKRNFIDTSDVLVRKDILFKVGGFDESIRKFIDWNLWVRIAKYGYKFFHVPIILTEYTVHKSMKSVVNTEGSYDPQTGLFTPTFDSYGCKINCGCIGSNKPLKVAIYTLTKDRLAYTKRTFESLRKTAGYEFDHYIVDQGSTDGTLEYLQEYKPYKLIQNDKNMGIPYASNQVVDEIKTGGYDIVVKVDNDVEFKTNNWLKAMVNIYEVFRQICLSPYPEGLVHNAGGTYRFNYLWLSGEFLGIVPHIGGMVSAVPIEVYSEFKWPKVAFLHGGNDVLLSSWLSTNGYVMAYMENHRAEHIDGTTGQQKTYPKYFELRQKETITRTDEFLKKGELNTMVPTFKTAIKHV